MKWEDLIIVILIILYNENVYTRQFHKYSK